MGRVPRTIALVIALCCGRAISTNSSNSSTTETNSTTATTDGTATAGGPQLIPMESCIIVSMPAPATPGCILTAMPTETGSDGKSYAFAPTSCNCGGALQSTTRIKGSDGSVTPACASDLPQTLCACGANGLRSLVITTTGSRGDVVYGCDLDTETNFFSTSKDNKETYNCGDLAGTVEQLGAESTTTPPLITKCSLAVKDFDMTESGTSRIDHRTVCACNGAQTREAMVAFVTTGKVYWCPDETTATVGPGAFTPITTVFEKPTSGKPSW
ncbi:hypothetical protein CERZMDRAFT_119077 [Cercospora zeae-maydis SCOH1-5]|uniref:Ig-like domain-containing protein n=1 Tax=Cercospora zeae-maydis SCOH1-5 TaxID=717836 RepID=A0A6A6F4X3_9PEZI|nr:hypothetical protein CERZMDRAFT_119077 [Cercospora zeae-maydis SCOH1-5]